MIAENERFFENHADKEVQRRGKELIHVIHAFQAAYFCREQPVERHAVHDERPLNVIKTFQRDQIIDALHESNGNMEQAAKAISMGKATLYNKMKALGISFASLALLLAGCATAPTRVAPPLPPMPEASMQLRKSLPLTFTAGVTLSISRQPSNFVAITATQLVPGHTYSMEQSCNLTNWVSTRNRGRQGWEFSLPLSFTAATESNEWRLVQAMAMPLPPIPNPDDAIAAPYRSSRTLEFFRLKDMTP